MTPRDLSLIVNSGFAAMNLTLAVQRFAEGSNETVATGTLLCALGNAWFVWLTLKPHHRSSRGGG